MMTQKEKESIFSYINRHIKANYRGVQQVFVNIDEKHKEIHVLVITKNINPQLETKLYDFEQRVENKYKVESSFKVVPSASYLAV